MRRPIKEALEATTRTLREIGLDVMRFDVQLQLAVSVALMALAGLLT